MAERKFPTIQRIGDLRPSFCRRSFWPPMSVDICAVRCSACKSPIVFERPGDPLQNCAHLELRCTAAKYRHNNHLSGGEWWQLAPVIVLIDQSIELLLHDHCMVELGSVALSSGGSIWRRLGHSCRSAQWYRDGCAVLLCSQSR
jgi:hypothetical protein